MKLQRYDIFASNSIKGGRTFAEKSDKGRYILAHDADALEKENEKLRDDITSLRVQLGAIGEFVKDRVNTALEMK